MSNILSLPVQRAVPDPVLATREAAGRALARRAALEAVIAEQGALKVLRAALASLLLRRHRPRTVHVRDLHDDWLRRDIGLPPMRDRWL